MCKRERCCTVSPQWQSPSTPNPGSKLSDEDNVLENTCVVESERELTDIASI